MQLMGVETTRKKVVIFHRVDPWFAHEEEVLPSGLESPPTDGAVFSPGLYFMLMPMLQ